MMILIPSGAKPKNDREAMVLSHLMEMTSRTKLRREQGHWIGVPSTEWRSVTGSRYSKTLSSLEKAGYIEINNRYSAGRFPKSYRLQAEYRNPKTEKYENSQRRKVPSSIRIQPSDRVGNHLVEQFLKFKLPETLAGWDDYCAKKIQLGQHYATRCRFGRFHSTFTSLRRDARTRLAAQSGKQLVEMDVRNCQPLVVGLLATQHKQGDPTTNNNNHPNDARALKTICGPVGGVPDDLADYLELCCEGQLYDKLVALCDGRSLSSFLPQRLRISPALDRPMDRDDIKHQFIVMLFQRKKATENMPIFEVVKNSWPTVADYLLQKKSVNYKDLATQCQETESSLIIDGACKNVFEQNPNTPLITIHDGIICELDDFEMVSSRVREEFQSFDVTPAIYVKSLGSARKWK